jgi:hypothetical protein
MTISRKEMLQQGGTYIEILNESQDGIVYIPINLAEHVNDTISTQPLGEVI